MQGQYIPLYTTLKPEYVPQCVLIYALKTIVIAVKYNMNIPVKHRDLEHIAQGYLVMPNDKKYKNLLIKMYGRLASAIV